MQMMDNLMFYALQAQMSAAINVSGLGERSSNAPVKDESSKSFDDMIQEKGQEYGRKEACTGPNVVVEETKPRPQESPDTLQQELMAALIMQAQAQSVQDYNPELEAPMEAIEVNLAPIEAQLPQQAAPQDVLTVVQPEVQEVAAEVAAPKTMQAPQAPTASEEPAAQEQPVEFRVSEPTQQTQQHETNTGEAKEFARNAPELEKVDELDVTYAGQTQETPLFEGVERAPIKVADAPVLDAQSSEFEEDLFQELDWALDAGMQKIEIRLTPDNLGSILAQFTQSADGSLKVVIQATSEKAAGMLNEHVASLGAMMQANGQNEVRIEVQNTAQPEQQQQQDAQNNEGKQQQQQQRQPQQQQSQDFLDQLRLGMVQSYASVS